MNDLVLHVFEEIGLLADVRYRDCLDRAARKQSPGLLVGGLAVCVSALRLRMEFVFFKHFSDETLIAR